jgi:hypothetical protein
VERDFISMPANNKLPLQQVALVLTRTHYVCATGLVDFSVAGPND